MTTILVAAAILAMIVGYAIVPLHNRSRPGLDAAGIMLFFLGLSGIAWAVAQARGY